MSKAAKTNQSKRTSGDQSREAVEYNPVNMAGKKADQRPGSSRSNRTREDGYNPVNMAGKKASDPNGSTVRGRRGN